MTYSITVIGIIQYHKLKKKNNKIHTYNDRLIPNFLNNQREREGKREWEAHRSVMQFFGSNVMKQQKKKTHVINCVTYHSPYA